MLHLHDPFDDGYVSWAWKSWEGYLNPIGEIIVFVHALILESLQAKVNSNINCLDVVCQVVQLNCPLIDN